VIETKIDFKFVSCTEFPFGCITFEGPHQSECKRTLWKKTGCLPDGKYNPANYNLAQDYALDNYTLW